MQTVKNVTYTVNEMFKSFQGEGVHAGRLAAFVRLQGCDQACSWCDSASTWHPGQKPDKLLRLNAQEIAEQVALLHLPAGALVVLTGGEPTLYDLKPLGDALIAGGWRVHLETAGHHKIPWPVHWVCVSPKTHGNAMPPLPSAVDRADEFKIIVEHPKDIERGLAAIAGRSRDVPVWLHPEWEMRDNPQVLHAICQAVDSIPGVRAGIQMHKFYGAR